MRLGKVGPPASKPGGAFTLIELLIVVAIISILAAIAVPNFLEAQTRAKVSRVKADMRSLAVAIESYAVDNNKYPPRQKYPAWDLNPAVTEAGQQNGLGDVKTRTQDMKAFTTPISYITSLPIDVFEQRVKPSERILDYYSPRLVAKISATAYNPLQPPDFGWGLVSVGPDTVMGQAGTMGDYPVSSGTHYNNEYDPTNGTVSVGNLTRFQKNGATATNAFKKP